MESDKSKEESLRKYILFLFKSGDDISVPLIQRRCKSGYFLSQRVFESLVSDELIDKPKNTNGISKLK
mgnify:CR=1 FL=1